MNRFTLLLTAALSFAIPAHAQKADIRIHRLTAKTYTEKNPEENNLLNRAALVSGGGSDGKQGGGSSKLQGSLARGSKLLLARLSVEQALGNRDWSRESTDSTPAQVQAMLEKDPVEILQDLSLQISERCTSDDSSNGVVLSDDFKSLCVPVRLSPNDYPSLWLSVLSAVIGEEWVRPLKLTEPDQKAWNHPNEMLRRKFNLSYPASAENTASLTCIYYVEEGGTRSYSQRWAEIPGIQEVRRHADGTYVVRTSERYEVCAP